MIRIPRANFAPVDGVATLAPLPENETDVARETVALMNREMALSLAFAPDMAVIRVAGKGDTAVHIGMTPERSIKMGQAMIAAGLRLKPSLRTDELKVIEGQGND